MGVRRSRRPAPEPSAGRSAHPGAGPESERQSTPIVVGWSYAIKPGVGISRSNLMSGDNMATDAREIIASLPESRQERIRAMAGRILAREYPSPDECAE